VSNHQYEVSLVADLDFDGVEENDDDHENDCEISNSSDGDRHDFQTCFVKTTTNDCFAKSYDYEMSCLNRTGYLSGCGFGYDFCSFEYWTLV